MKFNELGIFQCLKLRNLTSKILRISPKLNFTPDTLGCYGLRLNIPMTPPHCSIITQKSEKNPMLVKLEKHRPLL